MRRCRVMKRRNFTFLFPPSCFINFHFLQSFLHIPPFASFILTVSLSLAPYRWEERVRRPKAAGSVRTVGRQSDRQRDRQVRSWRGVKYRERKEKLRCSLCSLSRSLQKSQRQGDTEVASFLHQIACGRKSSNCKKTKKKNVFYL